MSDALALLIIGLAFSLLGVLGWGFERLLNGGDDE